MSSGNDDLWGDDSVLFQLTQTDEWEEMTIMDNDALLYFSKTNETAKKIFENKYFWEDRSRAAEIIGMKHEMEIRRASST